MGSASMAGSRTRGDGPPTLAPEGDATSALRAAQHHTPTREVPAVVSPADQAVPW